MIGLFLPPENLYRTSTGLVGDNGIIRVGDRDGKSPLNSLSLAIADCYALWYKSQFTVYIGLRQTLENQHGTEESPAHSRAVRRKG